MKRYEYEILIGRDAPNVAGGVLWYLSSDMRQVVGDNVRMILNALGDDGWEAVAAADLGYDARTEILLRRRCD